MKPTRANRRGPAKQTRIPARFEGAGDARFFFLNHEMWFVVPGTIGLGIIELDLIPKRVPFYDWVTDWKVLLVIGLFLLVLVPPIIARGRQHLRTREGYNRRSGAQSFALESVRGRASQLVSKAGQAERGEKPSKEYLAHTMSACHTYFRGRKFMGTAPVDGRSAQIDVVYYTRADRPQTQMLQKVKANDGSQAPFMVSVSSRAGSQVKALLTEINTGKVSLAPADFHLWGEPFFDGAHTYITGVGVPVFDSPKDDRKVVGVLLVVSDDEESLHSSDHEYLETQAWMLSVSFAIEGLTRRPAFAPPRTSSGVSGPAATVVAGE